MNPSHPKRVAYRAAKKIGVRLSNKFPVSKGDESGVFSNSSGLRLKLRKQDATPANTGIHEVTHLANRDLQNQLRLQARERREMPPRGKDTTGEHWAKYKYLRTRQSLRHEARANMEHQNMELPKHARSSGNAMASYLDPAVATARGLSRMGHTDKAKKLADHMNAFFKSGGISMEGKKNKSWQKLSADTGPRGLREGFMSWVKGKAQGLYDKHLAPSYHSAIGKANEPGGFEHSAHTQGHVTKMHRLIGAKQPLAPTLLRKKDIGGMAADLGAVKRGEPGFVYGPSKGKPVGIGSGKSVSQATALPHELHHIKLMHEKDPSHVRTENMVPKLNAKHEFFPPILGGGLRKVNPKALKLQGRMHMRKEAKTNMDWGDKPNRLHHAKKAMFQSAKAMYGDMKTHGSPEQRKDFVGRYKGFRKAWQSGDKTAHLKLSTDTYFNNLMEARRK